MAVIRKSFLSFSNDRFGFKIPTLLYLYVTNKDINKISAIPNLQIENIPYMLLCTLAGIILPLFICKVLNNFLIIKRLNHE